MILFNLLSRYKFNVILQLYCPGNSWVLSKYFFFSFSFPYKLHNACLVIIIRSKIWPSKQSSSSLLLFDKMSCCLFPKLNSTEIIEKLVLCSFVVCTVQLISRVSMPNCSLTSWVILTVLCAQTITAGIHVAVHDSIIICSSLLILYSEAKMFTEQSERLSVYLFQDDSPRGYSVFFSCANVCKPKFAYIIHKKKMYSNYEAHLISQSCIMWKNWKYIYIFNSDVLSLVADKLSNISVVSDADYMEEKRTGNITSWLFHFSFIIKAQKSSFMSRHFVWIYWMSAAPCVICSDFCYNYARYICISFAMKGGGNWKIILEDITFL